MERSMLGLTLRNPVPNEEMRRRTKVMKAFEKVASLKWNTDKLKEYCSDD